MKKFLPFLLATLFLSMGLQVSAAASAAASEDQQTGIQDLKAVLNQQMDQDEYAQLSDESHYAQSLQGVDFSLDEGAIVKVYDGMYWDFFHLPISEVIEKVQDSKSSIVVDYLVVGESTVRLRKWAPSDEAYTVGLSPNSASSAPIRDIENASATMNILDESCTLSQIYCFDGFNSHAGAAVYYLTDKGTFVRYYEKESSSGVWFTENDFRCFAEGYYAYLISPEHNYNENGELIGDGTLSFLSYTNSIKATAVHEADVPDSSTPSQTPVFMIIAISVGVLAVISAAVVLVAAQKRRHTVSRGTEAR